METFYLILICSISTWIASVLLRKIIKRKASFRVWGFGISGMILIPFGLAWAVTSVYEGEPFAAYMGVAVFSGLGLIFSWLAYVNFKKENNTVKNSAQKTVNGQKVSLGVSILVGLLIVLGAALLPLTIATNKVSNLLGNKEKAVALIQNNIVSDQSLPKFIKSNIVYKTLYTDYTESVEERLMQAMVIGVDDKELAALVGKAIPEPERIVLVEDIANGVQNWVSTDEAYPQITLNTENYVKELADNTEYIMSWLYRNFSFPPMDDEKVAGFNAGEFSTNIEDYIGTPPDSLKSALISNGAIALKRQLTTADIPSRIVLADKLREQIEVPEIQEKKSALRSGYFMMKNTWLIAVLCLMTGLGLALWKIPNKLKVIGYTTLTVAVIGFITSNALSDIPATVSNTIEKLSESAPFPALALMESLLPDILFGIKSSVYGILKTTLLIGTVLLLWAYRKEIGTGAQQLFSVIRESLGKKKNENLEQA